MMSKPITKKTVKDLKKLWNKFLKTGHSAVIVTCAHCDSINVKFDKQHERTMGDRTVYQSRYICQDCGSECNNTQEWIKGTPTPETTTDHPKSAKIMQEA